jgi:hypothetical protein
MLSKPWKIAAFTGLIVLFVLNISVYSQLELPTPTGSYAVSRTVLKWEDASRREDLTDDPNDFREVVAMVWYPAAQGTGVKTGYFPNLAAVSNELIQSGEVEMWQVFGLHFIRSENYFDAVPVKAENPFPVVILSPGNGTNIEFYSILSSEIASHGYIVVGLNHPYDVPAVELSNGEVATYDKEQWLLDAADHQAYIAERIKVRTADILFTLEQLERMNLSATNPFARLMDLDSVAVAGHSLGGITASEACKADARFKACLNFDGLQRGGPFSMEESATPPQQPFLFLTKESQLHPKLIERFESMSESYWVVVHGASHQSFTDGPLLQPSLLPGPNEVDRLMSLIQKYTLAFLDHTLKGQANMLLSTAASTEKVSVRVFPSN